MWELRDEVTNKVIFVGSEEECMKYSKEHPGINYILTKAEKALLINENIVNE